MSKNQVVDPNTAPAAETPQSTVKLDPEALVEQIRLLRSLMEEVIPLTPAQKRTLRDQSRKQPDAVVASSINMIGALENVALAIGQKPEEVRRLQTDWNRWTAVADELRALLNGVEGANLVRRQRLALISAQAYSIGKQLARNPVHSILVPHVQELKRLKSFSNRKKTAADPQTPAPNQAPAPKHDTPTTTPKA
jgi:hypothetical protein